MDDHRQLAGATWREVWRACAATAGGPCEVCRQWSVTPFCDTCLPLYRRAVPRCPRCALPTPVGRICAGCVEGGTPVERTVVAFDYAFPWDRAILDLKFNARTDLARPLAAALALALDRTREAVAGPSGAVDALVPIPLSPTRLAERGFNQSLLLARHLAAALHRPVEMQLLQRPIDTAHQAELSREQRVQNLRGAFMVDPLRRAWLSGRRVALVDDVVTTGATAAEAARELLRGGARAVELWAVARTA